MIVATVKQRWPSPSRRLVLSEFQAKRCWRWISQFSYSICFLRSTQSNFRGFRRLTIVLYNNYLKGYSFFFPFFLLILILYSSLGKQCWYTCSRKGGKCDRFCGKDAVCCRKDWRMESGCENAQSPCVGKHCCTKKKGIVKTRIRKFSFLHIFILLGILLYGIILNCLFCCTQFFP